MSFSYSFDPSSSTRDKVRFLIGDTNSARYEFHDSEIDAVLTEENDNAMLAAIVCADTLSGRYAGRPDKKIGDLSYSYGSVAKQYRDLAATLRRRLSLSAAAPYAGGISVSDRDIDRADTDAVQPSFWVGMQEAETDDVRQET